MNNADTKILERVRQLLAMAADTSSPHEAAIAAGRARKLMDKHQIDLADLKDESTGFGFQKIDKAYRYMPEYRMWLSVRVAQYNDCQAVKSIVTRVNGSNSYSYQIVFQGYETDVQLAAAMYAYLTDTIDRLCKVYMGRVSPGYYSAKLGDAFKKEASRQVCERLRLMTAEREQLFHTAAGTALMVIKNAAVAAHFGGVRYVTKPTAKQRQGAEMDHARAAGREAGRSMPLQHELA